MNTIKESTKHFTVYKTTNLINNKIYIGIHKTTNPNDKYLGSGKLLLEAVRKYGEENFRKEVLFDFNNDKQMKEKEKEIVTEEFCRRKDTYNITLGGEGGWFYVNKSGLAKSKEHTSVASRHHSFLIKNDASYRQKYIKIMKERMSSKDVKEKIKASRIRNGTWRKKTFLGKRHTEETKQRISNSRKGKQTTSTLGKHWYTNGKENIICFDSEIPKGFSKGRIKGNTKLNRGM